MLIRNKMNRLKMIEYREKVIHEIVTTYKIREAYRSGIGSAEHRALVPTFIVQIARCNKDLDNYLEMLTDCEDEMNERNIRTT